MTHTNTPFHRLTQLLHDHRHALTGADLVAQKEALDLLQAVVHVELREVRTAIVLELQPTLVEAEAIGALYDARRQRRETPPTAETERRHCGMRSHAPDCDCRGMGGDR